MIRILVAALALLCAVPAQAVDLKNSVTSGYAFTATDLPEPGALGLNRADGLLFYKNAAGTVLSASLLKATATGQAAITAANAAALATAAGLGTGSTPTFVGLTLSGGPFAVTGTATVTGALKASGTVGYAPITVVGNPGSGWGASVEWQGNAVVLGFDGSNNTPKFQSRTGGTVGGALGTGFGNLGLNPEGGNVGVGTTNPGTKLDVIGTLRTTGLSLNYAGTSGTCTITGYIAVTINGAAKSLPYC